MKFLLVLCVQCAFYGFSLALGDYQTVCYQDLGCFTNEPPWGDTSERPLELLPDSPENVNTRFYLDTRSRDGVEIYNDNMAGIAATSFSSNKMTRLIIHGYTDNGDTRWMNEMSDSLLAVGDENVIRVGWFGGSLQVNYASSAVDTQIVGAETALLITNIISYFGMSNTQFHCIGHSLGAQACGYIGNSLNIGRISGLDPAGPYFEGTPAEVRLDETDADFVDVVHTDADKLADFGFGTAQQSGDVDFWPNDGIEQPGCDQNAISTVVGVDGVVDGSRNFVACNHLRAIKFYTESITTSCPFKSYPCLSYADFLNGKCLTCDGTGCPQLGFHADSYKNEVYKSQTYLETNALAPFCQLMTDVVINLGSNSKSIKGELYVTMYGSNNAATEQEQMGGEDTTYDLRPGGYYGSLLYYDINPGDLDHIKVLWVQDEIDIGKSYITVQGVSVWVGATQQEYCFCGDLQVEMSEKVRYTLNQCSC